MTNEELHRIPADVHLDQDKLLVRRLSPQNDALHSHDFLELVYVMRGSAMHRLGTEAYRVTSGDYFIVDFGSAHCYQETDHFEIVNCLFVPEYVDRALISSRTLSSVLSRRQLDAPLLQAHAADRRFHDDGGHIRSLFETMVEEYENKPAGYQEIIRCHVIEILVSAARLASAMEPHPGLHPAAAAMAEHLMNHYAEPLSLDRLSERLGYTPQYLSALFHREAGMSLSAYLQKVRVEKSCALLAETRMPVSGIAQEVGYQSVASFSNTFATRVGVTPSRFRQYPV